MGRTLAQVSRGKVSFFSPDQHGIYSNIETHIPNKVMQFKHIGSVLGGKEQSIDDDTEKSSGATEIYRITAGTDGSNTLTIEIDVMDEHLEFMADKLPKALEKVKSLSTNL